LKNDSFESEKQEFSKKGAVGVVPEGAVICPTVTRLVVNGVGGISAFKRAENGSKQTQSGFKGYGAYG